MKFDLSNPLENKKAISKFKAFLDKKKNIELKALQNKRSISVNSYLHVAITIFAIEFGYTIEEAKTLLKRLCTFMSYEKNGSVFLKRTRDMTSKEVSDFIEWIRNYANSQGLYIADAEEYKTNKFSIDKEIDKHKVYL